MEKKISMEVESSQVFLHFSQAININLHVYTQNGKKKKNRAPTAARVILPLQKRIMYCFRSYTMEIFLNTKIHYKQAYIVSIQYFVYT